MQAGVDLALDAKVALLKKPNTYPDAPRKITAIETHMSWVFLTDTHAYKLKKPVRYPYLDFGSLGAREFNCREEYRLNQRLAPGVYLSVVPLCRVGADSARLEGEGAIVEWLVKMRRLSADRFLDNLIKAQALAASDVAAIAAVLVEFYREAGPIPVSARAHRERLIGSIGRNRDVLAAPAHALPAAQVQSVHGTLLNVVETSSELFDQRVRDKRIIEGHGDLRPEHICLEKRPIIFDRLEFNRDLRIIDPVDELAFLSMECERLGAAFVKGLLLEAYMHASGDTPPDVLINFYTAHRACLRARLAVLHTVDAPPSHWPHWRAAAADYLQIAASYCDRLVADAAARH